MLVRNRGVDHACPALQGILQTQTAPRRTQSLENAATHERGPRPFAVERKKLLDGKTIHERGRALFRAVVSKGGVGMWEQPPSAMSWLEEANFQMLHDHQCALVWVDACRHEKTFSKSWAIGCNSAKIQALEARRNHSYTHQSIAGAKEQGVHLSTLTAEYPPSLALQLAQVGVGRVSKTGSVRQAWPLHSEIARTISLAPGRLPTCDGAGMHSSADWCHPGPAPTASSG